MTESSVLKYGTPGFPKIVTYFPTIPLGDITLLNLGCGRSDSPLSIQMPELPVLLMANLDIYEPDLDYLKTIPHAAETTTFHVHNLRAPLPFGSGSFSMVVGIDVVEHLGAASALRLINEAERVARHRVLWFIPLGPCPSFAEGKENPHQEHLSVWWTHDLEALGFEVHVLEHFHDFTTTTFDACFAWKDV